MSQSQEAQASANGAAPCANQVCMRLRDFRPESRPQSSSLEPRLLNTLCPPAAFSSSIRQPRLLGLINTLRARYLLLTCSTISALLCPTTSILLQAVVLSAILTALCFSGRNQSKIRVLSCIPPRWRPLSSPFDQRVARRPLAKAFSLHNRLKTSGGSLPLSIREGS